MVVTTSRNKIYFQVISPSEDLQLGACAAILNIPVTHWQGIFPPNIFYTTQELFFLCPISKFQFDIRKELTFSYYQIPNYTVFSGTGLPI